MVFLDFVNIFATNHNSNLNWQNFNYRFVNQNYLNFTFRVKQQQSMNIIDLNSNLYFEITLDCIFIVY